jgi:phage terminase large subunit-like protein
MTSAEAGSEVVYNASPGLGLAVYVFTYTKANAVDWIVASTYCPIKTILFVKANFDADGTDDPVTWSGQTITMSTGTGAARMVVVGKC